MDVTLYAIALAVFAVLYLAIGVFLAFALIITLLILFLYLAVRYRDLPDGYPYSRGDAITTMIFIGITWAIFTFVSDKNPLPFIGSGLTYTQQGIVPLNTIIAIGFVVAVLFLGVFSVLGPTRENTSGGEDSSTPQRTVGSG
jgi:phosphatidylglycerophosphate synthase